MAAVAGTARAVASARRIAALPMYDLPGLQAATDALWRALAQRLVAAGVDGVPDELTRGVPPAVVWHEPHLLLAQSCGYPLVTSLRRAVKVVATPRYRAVGCEGAFARSAVVVPIGHPATTLADLRGSRCVINELASNSGMNLLRAAIAPLAAGRRFFRTVRVSFSHAESVRMVAAGEADIAAIDCVTLAHLQRGRSSDLAAAVRVLFWTEPSPGLPLVTSRDTDDATVAAIRAALVEVAEDPGLAALREALLIAGFDVLPETAYESVLEIERFAIRLDYPKVR
jgi:ABC-type phosphate/phosphonate transport system substrate-binding protein